VPYEGHGASIGLGTARHALAPVLARCLGGNALYAMIGMEPGRRPPPPGKLSQGGRPRPSQPRRNNLGRSESSAGRSGRRSVGGNPDDRVHDPPAPSGSAAAAPGTPGAPFGLVRRPSGRRRDHPRGIDPPRCMAATAPSRVHPERGAAWRANHGLGQAAVDIQDDGLRVDRRARLHGRDHRAHRHRAGRPLPHERLRES